MTKIEKALLKLTTVIPSEFLQKLVKRILDLLPLNGSKTSIGAILAIIGLIRFGVPGVDLLDVAQAIWANPTRAGIITVLFGVLHKALKTKYPDVKI